MRQLQLAQVGLYDGQLTAETLTQDGCSTRMKLDRKHSRACLDQGSGECAGAGAQVEDQVARPDAGLIDEPLPPLRL